MRRISSERDLALFGNSCHRFTEGFFPLCGGLHDLACLLANEIFGVQSFQDAERLGAAAVISQLVPDEIQLVPDEMRMKCLQP